MVLLADLPKPARENTSPLLLSQRRPELQIGVDLRPQGFHLIRAGAFTFTPKPLHDWSTP